jgi:hypothetical protein
MPEPRRAEHTRPVFRSDRLPAVDRLDAHLLALRRHLETVGLRAEASAVTTELQILDEVRREQRLRVVA